MILPIYNCFHPVLREKTNLVSEFDKNLNKLAENMLETMRGADGIGLAGNQVGENKSILWVDEHAGEEPSKHNPILMINPNIVSFSETKDDYREGCLSIPQFFEYVTRPTEIEVEYQDINGQTQKLACGELLARVIQHEVDHLKGILFFDHLTPLKRAMSKGKLRKIENGQTSAHYNMINPDGSENIID